MVSCLITCRKLSVELYLGRVGLRIHKSLSSSPNFLWDAENTVNGLSHAEEENIQGEQSSFSIVLLSIVPFLSSLSFDFLLPNVLPPFVMKFALEF